MQSTITILVALVCVAMAQVSVPPGYKERYPNHYPWAKNVRHARDVTWDRSVGNGKVFGTLGSNDQGLFGKGGYKETIFNDARGKLDAQAYGSRVLSPAGDSSHFGGKLDWANDNAKAALDISKQIHGKTTVSELRLHLTTYTPYRPFFKILIRFLYLI
ncbi:gloverin-like isoform X2 [Leguminivora glycinivorella]|uniref:gloverin-like isoform X2 n=1 Tax=Leguminivora glycinivorella TaxID=1035111 RepID=UPI00200DB8FD|nr:gloverin-like isoform X2 [Leguminivora glycinivorella]